MKKTSEEKSSISFSTMFQFEGCRSECVKDMVNEVPGEKPIVTLKILPKAEDRILFSYAPKDGLNVTGVAGGIYEKNILGKLLAIPKGDANKHIEFIEKYGFFYPLPEGEYTAIDADALMEIVNRIKTTIHLYGSVNKKDYRGILVKVVYLLFSPAIGIQIGTDIHSSCLHRFSRMIQEYNNFPDLSGDPEVLTKGTYSVEDSFLGRKNHIDIECYNAIRSGEGYEKVKGSKESSYKHLVAMYVGCKNVDTDTRFLIDFFYHLETEIAVINEAHFGGFTSYGRFNENNLNDDMKRALLRVAQIVLAEEINYNIRGIHPRYDGGNLSATWEVNTLIEALYFSIFYMKNGQMYKECENPNCKRDRFFLVDATRTNKHYCCEQCRNAAGAQRHRQRILKQQ